MCVVIFSETFSETFLVIRRIERDMMIYIYIYIGLHVKYQIPCQVVMKPELSRQIFEKYSSTKFHENPSSGSRVISCGWTDGHEDITKLIGAFRNFENVPKMPDWSTR